MLFYRNNENPKINLETFINSGTSPISAPPVNELNIISSVDDIPQFQQQGTREAASSQTEKDRAKFHINWAINDILNSSSLKCPFCQKSTDFKKAGFFARHVNLKHGYFLNAMEQRMVKENLEKISRKQQQAGQKKKVLLNPSFLQSHRQDMMELNRARKRPVFDEKLDKMESQVKLGKLSQQEINKQIQGKKQPIINQARKRPIFDEKLDEVESTVKLGKLGQQEIDQQIREGEKRPTLKTNRRRIKKSFRPIPPDKWERIQRAQQIQRRRAGKRKNREEDEEEKDDEKVRKLNPAADLRELPFYLPPTLRGKRLRSEEDDYDDDDIIVKKQRKMITKKI